MAKRTHGTTPSALAVREKALQAVALRKAGASYADIAERCGYKTTAGAYKAVTRILQQAEREEGTELLELELSRLDDLLRSVWVDAKKGKLGNVDRALNIIEKRAKLLGLGPTKLELSGPEGGPIETTQRTGVVMLPEEDDSEGGACGGD